MRSRHVPQRTCVVCGTKVAQRELVRVALTPDDGCHVDETGRRAGRGAYLCRRRECWDRALRSDRLARSLRGELSAEDKARLAAFASGLRPEGDILSASPARRLV